MRISNFGNSALTTAIALAALAGCGGAQMAPTALAPSGAASPSNQRAALQDGRLSGFRSMHGGDVPSRGGKTPSFMDRRAVVKPLLFVSYGGTIGIYLQGGKNKMVGQITPPQNGFDIATDTAGNVYSANLGISSYSVTVYAPPYTKGPKLTLTGRTAFPIAVSRQGTVAVLGCTNPSGTECVGGFLFYAAGSTTPCAGVPVDPSTFSNGIFGAGFDGKGNLFFDSDGSGTAAPLPVGKISGGCSAKKAETFTTANSIPYAADIRIDKAGRIAILVAVGTNPYTIAIDTYNPPKKGSLGDPVSTTSLPGTINNTSGTFAFQASGRRLWAGYYSVGPSYAAAVDEFAYPAGGVPEKTVKGAADSYPYAEAVTPALVP